MSAALPILSKLESSSTSGQCGPPSPPVHSRDFPDPGTLELVWAAAASVSHLCGCCFLKSKQRAACLRMEDTSTPDSGTHGQVVRVPELPGRLRPHPAPLRPHVQVQTQPGHFLRAEQPQAHGFPIQNLSFFICRMEVMARPPCPGVGRVAMDMGQGRGTSCFLQFPAEALWA